MGGYGQFRGEWVSKASRIVCILSYLEITISTRKEKALNTTVVTNITHIT